MFQHCCPLIWRAATSGCQLSWKWASLCGFLLLLLLFLFYWCCVSLFCSLKSFWHCQRLVRLGKWSISIHFWVVSPYLFSGKCMKLCLLLWFTKPPGEPRGYYTVYTCTHIKVYMQCVCEDLDRVTSEHLCISVRCLDVKCRTTTGSNISLWSMHFLSSQTTFIIYISLCPSRPLSLSHPDSALHLSLFTHPPPPAATLFCRKGLALWWVH